MLLGLDRSFITGLIDVCSELLILKELNASEYSMSYIFNHIDTN